MAFHIDQRMILNLTTLCTSVLLCLCGELVPDAKRHHHRVTELQRYTEGSKKKQRPRKSRCTIDHALELDYLYLI